MGGWKTWALVIGIVVVLYLAYRWAKDRDTGPDTYKASVRRI